MASNHDHFGMIRLMESIPNIFAGVVIIFFFVLFGRGLSVKGRKQSTSWKSPYAYGLKGNIMTPSEREFFKLLADAASDKYYVFPQIHLSALFRNRTGGRYHRAAFNSINGRSVDYVLCDKTTLQPVYAVELDDPTHDTPDRQKRDAEVEGIFADYGFPLVRFREYRNLSREDIANRFAEARQAVQQDVLPSGH